MDIVYVCREGENEELRYSIRSVVENLESCSKVWVVGSKPDWYTGNFIPVENISDKFTNIRNCIKIACETDDISDDFVLMNDDFFILRKLNSVSLYHGGLLFKRFMQHQDMCGPNVYANLLARTDAALKKIGIKEPLNYDLHTPMVINKTKMLEIVDQPLSVRSLYGNIYEGGGEEIKDVKVYSDMRLSSTSSAIDNGTPFLSSEDGSFGKLQVQIHEMFPVPSVYEHPTLDSNQEF